MTSQKENLKIPVHIGIIMDGNGRWAKERKLPRISGHVEGVNAVRRIVKHAGEIGVKYLTLYAFSTENWKRPKEEVGFLMKMFKRLIKSEIDELMRNDVKLSFIGDKDSLSKTILGEMEKSSDRTKDNKGLNLLIAISYGGKNEIVNAVNKVLDDFADGKVTKIDENNFKKYLYTNDIPDPDLIIRTSGEQRLSNFLIYQAAYAELFFSDKLWPDFSAADLDEALEEYSKRQRRYGRV
ncbi:isoprenyl transferase [candidate division WOR-3 bacterium]|nr:isoprenyl transferase [candidate division WOR-3 bacterium]